MNKNRLYEAIMKDVSKSVRKHLNEISSGLVDRAISKAKERLSEPKLAPKTRQSLKRQLNVFNKYRKDNFTWEKEYNMLLDNVMDFYNNIDSEIVRSFLKKYNYDYDNVESTQSDINWNQIKTKMKKLYRYFNQYNLSESPIFIIEGILLIYYDIEYGDDWYGYPCVEWDYPDDDFYDYGEMLDDVKNECEYDIISLCKEFPKELLEFFRIFLWDTFNESKDLYNDDKFNYFKDKFNYYK